MDNMSSFGPGRILVVERDLAVSRFVEFVLGNWESFEVASVTDPAVALALLGNEPWDLVLVDFELPDTGVVDALGLLEAIREVEPGLPVAKSGLMECGRRFGARNRVGSGFITGCPAFAAVHQRIRKVARARLAQRRFDR